MSYLDVNALLGKTLTEISGADKGSKEIIFHCDDETVYNMYHSQDCCESVDVDDVVGDVADLIGSPILEAEEVTSREGENLDGNDSFTWTFYKLATIKGSVTIKWYGSSNGYYSESVYFAQINGPE